MSDSISSATKKCTRCKKPKPLSDFYGSSGSTYRQSICKPCNIEDKRERRARLKIERLQATQSALFEVPAKKVCSQCHKEKLIELFKRDASIRSGYASICLHCCSLLTSSPNRSRKRKRGVTPEMFEQMLHEQKGVCAACGKEQEGQRLSIDHDHVTGQVRGLLCYGCNIALGHLRDNPEHVLGLFHYIKKYKG
jgi:hypothetical protein